MTEPAALASRADHGHARAERPENSGRIIDRDPVSADAERASPLMTPSVAWVIDDAIAIGRRSWRAIAPIALVGALPFVPAVLACSPIVEGDRRPLAIGLATALGALALAWYAITDAAITIIARDAEQHGDLSALAALRAAASQASSVVIASATKLLWILSSVLLTTIVVTVALRDVSLPLAIAASSMMALYLAIYVSCRLVTVPATVVLGHRSPIAALRYALAQSHRRARRIALALVPAGIACVILAGALQIVVTLLSSSAAVAAAGGVAAQVLALPIVTIFATLLYRELDAAPNARESRGALAIADRARVGSAR